MATLKIPEGYKLHEVETKNLTSLLSFASAMMREFKVFVCPTPKAGIPKGELQVLLSDAYLSSKSIVAEKNMAVVHQIITELSKVGWTYSYQNGALLFFTPTDAVLL